MEFFRVIHQNFTEAEIQRLITLENLEKFSSQLFALDEPKNTTAYIGSLWGEFSLQRTVINGGVRFALLECPNALCWTITTGQLPVREDVVIHLTINRTKKDQEFITEIEEFLDDHQKMLNENIKLLAMKF